MRRLGHGSSGVVYHAVHGETGEDVALKRVQLESPRALPQLRREVHALSRLSHPGVVQIFSQGLDDHQPWYAMELLRGATLRQCIGVWWDLDEGGEDSTVLSATLPPGTLEEKRARQRADDRARVTQTLASGAVDTASDDGPVEVSAQAAAPRQHASKANIDASLAILLELSRTLAVLHGEGFVHRDLKPDNIFIRTTLEPVLVDFGLVTQLTSGHERLASGTNTAGTPRYMAPEQIHGLAVDARADLYALGCIFYECLTGSPPFDSTNVFTLLQMHVRQKPRPMRELNPAIPEELDALVMRLLAKEPHQRLGHAWDVVRALDPDAIEMPGRPYLYRPAFVGREALLQDMLAQLNRCARGHGAFWLVNGEAGIGKTRLLLELSVAAPHQGVQVLTGECYPDSGPLQPFQSFFNLITDRCRAGGAETTRALLGDHLAVLAPFHPELLSVPGAELTSELPQLDVEANRLRVLSHLRQVILKLSRRKPLLLIIDDAQWADDLSAAFLEQVAHTLDSDPVWCIASYRSDASDAELSAHALLRKLDDDTSVHHLNLEPISDASIASIVHDMLALEPQGPSASRGFVDFVVERAEGKPFFVAEYLRAALDAGILTRTADGRWALLEDDRHARLPDTLSGLIRHRIDGLDPDAHALLDEAAVLGHIVDAELLDATSSLEKDGARMEAMRELLHRQILEDYHELRFTNAALQHIAYARISEDRRAALHRRAATTLERTAPESLARIAHHWCEAHAPEQAFPALMAAAEAALDAGAYGDTRVWASRAEALVEAGLQLSPVEHARALILHASALWHGSSDPNLVTEKLHAALEVLGHGLPQRAPRWGLLLTRELSMQLFRQLTRHRLHRPLSEEKLEAMNAALVFEAIELLQKVQWSVGDMLPALATCALAANLGEDARAIVKPAFPYSLFGTMTGLMGLHGSAKHYFALARDLEPDPHTLASLHITEALYYEAHAQWDTYLEIVREGLRRARELEDRLLQESLGMQLSGHAFYAGSGAEVETILLDVLDSASRREADVTQAWTRTLLARHALRAGQPERALARARAAEPLMVENGNATGSLPVAVMSAAHLALGQHQDAREKARRVLELLDGEMLITYVHPCCYIAPTVVLSLLQHTLDAGGEDAELADLAQRAVALAKRFARRFPVGRPAALRAEATLRRLQGKRGARRMARRALDAARSSGMVYQSAMSAHALARSFPTGHPEHVHYTSLARDILGEHHWSIHFWWESP